MEINLEQVSLIRADPYNINHKISIWKIFNENLEFFLTDKPVSYINHRKWWRGAFLKEYIYVILYNSKICGYIRLTKFKIDNKDRHEISMAISKEYQNLGIGTYVYNLFEEKMKDLGITEIIANAKIENITGRNFWKKNGFKELPVKYEKQI